METIQPPDFKDEPVVERRPTVQRPTAGRIVHYVLSAGDSVKPDKVGEHRPAMIVKCWSDSCVQLQVFLDGTNDTDRLMDRSLMWVTSVSQNEEYHHGRTWHWPERAA